MSSINPPSSSLNSIANTNKTSSLAQLNQKRKTSKSSSKKESFSLKTPKGTKDFFGADLLLKTKIFDILKDVFVLHGGSSIDTPVFELKSILTNKYGEDSKLIYDLKDQGGELCSLRYDLTVPFARFVAQNDIKNIKRYHIAKVYRRDQPAMTKGRMREFYQCDFDIAGINYDKMVPDAEILKILVEGLTKLNITDFRIKLNHRKILDGIFKVCGVTDSDVRKVSSAVDKLDKESWDEVKREIVEEKNQSKEVADKIGEFVKLKGGLDEILPILLSNEELMSNPLAKEGIEEMKLLNGYISVFSISDFISFDLSLARGLDYYTGLIYEAVTVESKAPQNAKELKEKSKKLNDSQTDDASSYVGVGSIAAGGRYDNLVGDFALSNGKKNISIPCIGVSFGVERIFSIISSRIDTKNKVRSSSTDIFVMSFGGDGLLKERLLISNLLWSANLKTEFVFKKKVNARKQFLAAEKIGASIGVIIGQEEYVNENKVRVKVLGEHENSNEGELVEVDNLISYIKNKLNELNGNLELDEISRLIQGL
ncbi:histidine--tRNA ligase [Ascoidea rubescens DSM 1968]|uniref:Histidine--tRNA ligase, mitochondrial n=1 Tax=Ascoidea rubescens DSM 1968 TaxID=1344418 RepID=A0A1D2VA16_9ASCO|nr:histidyl-tRNA synthetase [Ascoidea rubescens DSM 1968]ODV58488.1 histidyl-tRNA synthetase [Ascoidea rubescens DSM 1968]